MKKLLTAAGAAVLAGIVIAGIAFIAGAGRNNELPVFETETITAENIVISAANAEVTVIKGDVLSVTYPSGEGTSFSGRYENGTYIAEYSGKERSIFDLNLELSLEYDEVGDELVTVEVPEGFAGGITISTDSGDISVSGIDAAELKADSESGDILVTHTGARLDAYTAYGDIRLNGLDGNVSAATDTGDIDAENLGGGEIAMESRVGDIYLLADGKESDYSVNGTGGGSRLIRMSSAAGDTEVEFGADAK